MPVAGAIPNFFQQFSLLGGGPSSSFANMGLTAPSAGIGANLGYGAGAAGMMGGGANMMPGMAGFGPMAQVWGGIGALDSLFRKDVQGDVDPIQSMFGNAAQGALAGSYFGPIGIAIGAGIGALGGSK